MENDMTKVAAPSLTLEPDLEEKPETAVAAAPVAEEPKIPEPVLTPEEQQAFDASCRTMTENYELALTL